MWRLVAGSLLRRKRRFVSVVVSVVMAVAFLSGTLVITDTMRASFDEIFTEANQSIAVVVRPSMEANPGARGSGSSVPQSLLREIRATEGVAQALPVIEGIGQLVTRQGELIGGTGPPTLASSWLGESPMNPYHLTFGRAPQKDGELVISESAATSANIAVGDDVGLLTPTPRRFTVTGLVRFGETGNMLGASYAGLSFQQAQTIYQSPGRVSRIIVSAQAGVESAALRDAISEKLPNSVQAVTGQEVTNDQKLQIEQGFLSLFSTFLLVFAGIAIVVAAFSVHNTYAVVFAQRSREIALLRALGAVRGQVVRNLLGESSVVGLAAAVVGAIAGIGLATVIIEFLKSQGAPLPVTGLTVSAQSLLVAILVGTVVTVVASALPAVRASRVAPLDALRATEAEPAILPLRRLVTGIVITLAAAGIVGVSMVADVEYPLAWLGVGGLGVLVGVVAWSPFLMRGFGRLADSGLRGSRAIATVLGARSLVRNARKSASTAAALTIAVAVVTLFTVFAASIKLSIASAVEASIRADLVVSSQNYSGAGLPYELNESLSQVDGVASVAAIGSTAVRSGEDRIRVTVTDPKALDQAVAIDTQGLPLSELGPAQIAVDDTVMAEQGWSRGDTVDLLVPGAGTFTATIATTYPEQQVVAEAVVPIVDYPGRVDRLNYPVMLVNVDPGASVEQVQANVAADLRQLPGAQVQTTAEFVDFSADQVDQLLTLVYVLLVLAVLIAVFGIGNTLSLAIFERTRELGMLRAIGLSRAQTARMIRAESVIVALVGTVLGVVVGTGLSWAVMTVLGRTEDFAEFALPFTSLLVIVVAGCVAGILAAVRPARRAARLDVLAAIRHD